MALIKIESGEVTRHVGTRGAFAVAETVTLPDGRTFPKSYTVWQDNEAPAIGAIVAVTGVMSAKIREYESQGNVKHAIDISINDPEVTIMGNPKPATPEATAAEIQAIADSAVRELPF